jgi:hypothetical protein
MPTIDVRAPAPPVPTASTLDRRCRGGARHCLAAAILLGMCAAGCATLTPEGSRVSVYRAPLDGQPPRAVMPDGCRIITTKPRTSMTELDLDGQRDPFRNERNEAGAAGANTLLVRMRQTIGRRDMESRQPRQSPTARPASGPGSTWSSRVISAPLTPFASSPRIPRRLHGDRVQPASRLSGTPPRQSVSRRSRPVLERSLVLSTACAFELGQRRVTRLFPPYLLVESFAAPSVSVRSLPTTPIARDTHRHHPTRRN